MRAVSSAAALLATFAGAALAEEGGDGVLLVCLAGVLSTPKPGFPSSGLAAHGRRG